MQGRRQDRLLSGYFPQVAEFLAGSTSQPEVAGGFVARDTVRRRRNVHQILTRFLRQARHDVNAGYDKAKVRYLKLAAPASKDLLEGKEVSATPERWMKLFRFGQTE
jgi:hypothetical protein